MFLAALEEAGYKLEDNPAEAVLVRELVDALSSGKLLLMPTDDVWLFDEEEREDFAIAKLDQLIELVVHAAAAAATGPRGQSAAVLIRLTLDTCVQPRLRTGIRVIGHLPGSSDLHGTRGYVRWTDL